MSGEPVERKADSEAEGEPGNDRRVVRGENDMDGVEDPGSAVGGLLTDVEVGWTTVARLSLGVLLFGGLVLAFAGAGLWVEETLGTYPTMVVTGLGSIALSYVLAQVYARRGWI